MKNTKSFKEKVLTIVEKILPGSTLTYAQVAHLAGNDKAARAVGAILRKNYNPLIPCHRVIRTDGSMAGYNRGGPQRKKQLLEAEKLKILSSTF